MEKRYIPDGVLGNSTPRGARDTVSGASGPKWEIGGSLPARCWLAPG